MTRFRTSLLALAFAAAAAVALVSDKFDVIKEAKAQPAGAIQSIYPLTRDLGALITFSSQGAATLVSADQSGYNVSRVTCVYKATAQSGTPSTTINLQNKDRASGSYYTLISSAAITNSTTTGLTAGAGVASTANVSAALPLAANWRVTATFAGTSTPLSTGTVGCTVQ